CTSHRLHSHCPLKNRQPCCGQLIIHLPHRKARTQRRQQTIGGFNREGTRGQILCCGDQNFTTAQVNATLLRVVTQLHDRTCIHRQHRAIRQIHHLLLTSRCAIHVCAITQTFMQSEPTQRASSHAAQH